MVIWVDWVWPNSGWYKRGCIPKTVVLIAVYLKFLFFKSIKQFQSYSLYHLIFKILTPKYISPKTYSNTTIIVFVELEF